MNQTPTERKKVSVFLFYQEIRSKYSGLDKATIEDLAFPNCPSKEADEIGRRVCLSVASYAGAERVVREWREKSERERG